MGDIRKKFYAFIRNVHIQLLSCHTIIVNLVRVVHLLWQGNPDHASGLQTKLGCNAAGQFPLYQAAMSLMEEV